MAIKLNNILDLFFKNLLKKKTNLIYIFNPYTLVLSFLSLSLSLSPSLLSLIFTLFILSLPFSFFLFFFHVYISLFHAFLNDPLHIHYIYHFSIPSCVHNITCNTENRNNKFCLQTFMLFTKIEFFDQLFK